MMRFRTVFIILVTMVVMGAVRTHAQTVRTTGPQRVTVKADQAPLGALLDQLSERSSVKQITLDPIDRALPVSFEAEDVSAADAMVLALKASGLDYAISGTRLIAGRAKKALENGSRVVWGADGGREKEREVTPPAPRDARPQIDEHDLIQPVVPARVFTTPAGKEPGPRGPVSSDGAADDHAAASMSVKFTDQDEFGRALDTKAVPFRVVEDSAVVTQPGFVPYKLRPEVKNRRLFGNIVDIP